MNVNGQHHPPPSNSIYLSGYPRVHLMGEYLGTVPLPEIEYHPSILQPFALLSEYSGSQWQISDIKNVRYETMTFFSRKIYCLLAIIMLLS